MDTPCTSHEYEQWLDSFLAQVEEATAYRAEVGLYIP